MTRSLSIHSLMLLSLTLAACTQTPSIPAGDAAGTTPPTEPAKAMPNDALGGHRWQLQDATDAQGRRIDALLVRPEQPISFDVVDGRIRIANACNAISGAVRIDGETLTAGPLVSTKMACADPAVMALDDAIGQRLQGTIKFASTPGDPPQLVWTAANGDTLRFVGEPTPETRYGSAGETVFLEVAAKTKPCQHPMMPTPQRCLEVRERRYDAQGLVVGTPGEWQLFHDAIEGYTHEEGIRNVLRIKRYAIPNPPMDAPATAYVLEQSIESEQVDP